MEAEIIALAHSCRVLLPIIDVVTSLCDEVDLPKDLTTMHVSIHEDAGSLILEENLSP